MSSAFFPTKSSQKKLVQPRSPSAGDRLWTRAYGVRRKIATLAAGVLALGIGYHVVFGQNGLLAYQQKRLDAKTLLGELSALERENSRLKGHVDRLQSDPNAIEQQAREGLHYTRPGEVIYTLPAEPAKNAPIK